MDGAGSIADSNTCTPKRLCRKWRTCPRCAAIRQANIANQAEDLLSGLPDLRLYTARAEEGSHRSIESVKRTLRDLIQPTRGLWSIEQSAFGPVLHIHALAQGATITPRPGVIIWKSEPIRSIRAAAAYIVKPRSQPDPTIYPGRCFGTWGQVTRHLLDPSTPALVHAAAIEKTLHDRGEVIPDLDAKTAARIWLPRLYAIVGKTAPVKRP